MVLFLVKLYKHSYVNELFQDGPLYTSLEKQVGLSFGKGKEKASIMLMEYP